MRRLETVEFVDRSNLIHAFKYYYWLVLFTNGSTKVPIICMDHGIFWKSPYKHLAGQRLPRVFYGK